MADLPTATFFCLDVLTRGYDRILTSNVEQDLCDAQLCEDLTATAAF